MILSRINSESYQKNAGYYHNILKGGTEMDLDREHYINSVNLNIDTDFPYLVLNVVGGNAFPRNPGFGVMHWHEDLQFILVLDGTIEVRTLDTSVLICAGEGLFINKNVVHDVRRPRNCHYNSFLFPAYFLEFYAGSPAKDFVDSVTANDRLAFIHFTTALDWHREIIAQLKQLVQIEKKQSSAAYFYVYEVLVRLSLLWLVMRKHVALPQEQRESIVRLRMQKILRFIEKTLCGRYYIGRSGHERQYQQIGMFPLFQTEYEYHTL